MLKVLVACGCGMGSSQMIKMNASKVFSQLGVEADITHTSIGEAKGMAHEYDLIICAENFVKGFDKATQPKIVSLKNIMNAKELKEKLSERVQL